MRVVRSFAVASLILTLLAMGQGRANGQAVAFSPTVSSIPDGVSLNVTPVVTADRRYVRLSLAPQFQTVTGFTNYSVPGAIAGGGNGGGLGGALGGALGGGLGGGLGGAGGLAGGGLRSLGLGPVDFASWYPDLGVPLGESSLPPKPLKARTGTGRSKKPLPDPEIVPIKKKPANATAQR